MPRKRQKTTSLLASLPQELRLSLTSSKSAGVTAVQGEEHQPDGNERPTKRRRMDNILSKPDEKYDATGLVPFYAAANQVPENLKKCMSVPPDMHTNIP
jgi:hypothetical protein